jgi:hypothetical protein
MIRPARQKTLNGQAAAAGGELHGADPDRHGNEEGAHAHQRYDILNEIGHGGLLFLLCSYFVLILFKCQRRNEQETGLDFPSKERG